MKNYRGKNLCILHKPTLVLQELQKICNLDKAYIDEFNLKQGNVAYFFNLFS